jgi:hypothetical protein
MRADELTALKEQKRHLLVEFRSMVHRYDESGKAWSKPDMERRDYLIRELEQMNSTLSEEHKRELEENRAGGGGMSREHAPTGFERSFAREPLYEAFRTAGFARGQAGQIPWHEDNARPDDRRRSSRSRCTNRRAC